ncbi:MAG: alpha/beta hydrolase [Flammeovirgaceae bacterium]
MKKLAFNIIFCLFLSFTSLGGTVDTLKVYSTVMQKAIPTIVITPTAYATHTAQHYPVIYLLHGAYGDYTNYIRKIPELKTLVDRYQFIIVCPDGGNTSWYFDSPMDSSYQYETYITKELVPVVNQTYRISGDREKRGILGLSMGGHGAIYLASRNPSIWGVVGSMSGGVDFRPFPNSWDIKKRLGSKAKYASNWNKHTVITMIDQIKQGQFTLFIDCGQDDFFFEVNKAFHLKLLAHQVPHDFSQHAGKHDWNYWKQRVPKHLACFHEHFTD